MNDLQSLPPLSRPGRYVSAPIIDTPVEDSERSKRKRILIAVAVLGVLSAMSSVDGQVREKHSSRSRVITKVEYHSEYNAPSVLERLFHPVPRK